MEGMEPYQDAGKYLTICEKQADGSWLIKASTWNSDIPMPE
jgi:ketosteroid isomerase-like protein